MSRGTILQKLINLKALVYQHNYSTIYTGSTRQVYFSLSSCEQVSTIFSECLTHLIMASPPLPVLDLPAWREQKKVINCLNVHGYIDIKLQHTHIQLSMHAHNIGLISRDNRCYERCISMHPPHPHLSDTHTFHQSTDETQSCLVGQYKLRGLQSGCTDVSFQVGQKNTASQ